MKKLIIATALALSFAGGAIAQTTTGNTTGAAGASDSNPIGADMRTPFYTDNTMATMRSDDEMRTAYMGMSADQQKLLKDNCINPVEENKPLCEKIAPFQTQN